MGILPFPALPGPVSGKAIYQLSYIIIVAWLAVPGPRRHRNSLVEFAAGRDGVPVDAVLQNHPGLVDGEVSCEAPGTVAIPAIAEAVVGLIQALPLQRRKHGPRH